MKKIIFNCLIILTVIVTVQSCKPDKVPVLQKTTSVISTFAGTWKIMQATESDVVATSKGFPYKIMDITNYFPYSGFSLTLNMDGNIPTTFSTVQGNAPKIIRIPSGNWSFNNPTYPDTLILSNGSDTCKIGISSYPGSTSSQFGITVDRHDASNGKILVSYNYLLTK